MKKISIIILSVIAVFLFGACGNDRPELISINQNDKAYSQEDTAGDETEEATGEKNSDDVVIYVHVSGAVNCPGLYELTAGSRVYDAVMAAGGFSDEADENYANLAEILTDGMKYDILTKEQVKLLDEVSEQVSHYTEGGLLDINVATRQELMELPGIGGSKADGILEYRQNNGNFKSIEEIKNISGIGNGIFTDICAYITVR